MERKVRVYRARAIFETEIELPDHLPYAAIIGAEKLTLENEVFHNPDNFLENLKYEFILIDKRSLD